MWVMILYVMMSGAQIEYGVRSEDGVNPQKFASKEACEKQMAQDLKDEPRLREPDVKLVCEKR
jgi:hypothetical protein